MDSLLSLFLLVLNTEGFIVQTDLPFSIYPADITNKNCLQEPGAFALYCSQSSFNWCSKLDQGLSSFDYDNNAVGINYYYRQFYPKCLSDRDLNLGQMSTVINNNKTLDIYECAAACSGHVYALMKVRTDKSQSSPGQT